MRLSNGYNPSDNWSLSLEAYSFDGLSVTDVLDGLMVKIQNSNGLAFCPKHQVEALIELLGTHPRLTKPTIQQYRDYGVL